MLCVGLREWPSHARMRAHVLVHGVRSRWCYISVESFILQSTRHWNCPSVCASKRANISRWARFRVGVEDENNIFHYNHTDRCDRHRRRIEFIAFEKWILIYELEFDYNLYIYYIIIIAQHTRMHAFRFALLLLRVDSIYSIFCVPRKNWFFSTWCDGVIFRNLFFAYISTFNFAVLFFCCFFAVLKIFYWC